MNEKNTKKLFDDFPDLFNKDRMRFGFECMDGWFDIIYDLCKVLSIVSPPVLLRHVKEKFGSLRVYTNIDNDNDIAWDFINQAEKMSTKTCEVTGEKGRLCVRSGHAKTLSKEVAEEKGYERYNRIQN